MDSSTEELFDPDLPSSHSYLGDNLAPLSGRVIHEENALITLPLLPKPYSLGTILPGKTFPIAAHNVRQSLMIRYCLKHDHTFGCLGRTFNSNSITLDNNYGTTVEIIEYNEENGAFMCKGKARQRFRVVNSSETSNGYAIGIVQILPEVILCDPLSTKDVNSLNKLPRGQREKAKYCMAQTTPWPKWVFDQYDVAKLVEQIQKCVGYKPEEISKSGVFLANKKIVLPKDATSLSYFFATYLNSDEQLYLLKLNSPIQRLRWLLQTLNKPEEYKCAHCFKRVATKENMFAMSIEGVQGTYINPAGIYHDTITFYRVENCNISNQSSTEFSWFPGYAWSIATCAECDSHLGWRFSTRKPNLRPKQFYGLTRLSVTTQQNTPTPQLNFFQYLASPENMDDFETNFFNPGASDSEDDN